MNTKLIGRWGEMEAAKYLKSEKYKPIAMGFSTRYGEIDIIAESKDFLIFVEVKTRKDASFATAKDYVTPAKQRRIITAANIWLAENCCEKKIRFDVIELYYRMENNAPYLVTLNHIENAFYVGTDN